MSLELAACLGSSRVLAVLRAASQSPKKPFKGKKMALPFCAWNPDVWQRGRGGRELQLCIVLLLPLLTHPDILLLCRSLSAACS